MISIRYEGPDELFIKLFYKFRNWRWFHDPATRDMFIWLLLHVNRNDENFERITIHRGEKVTSYEHMAQELGFSINQMRRAEKNLKSTGEITVRIYPHFQVISIVNFNKYQPDRRQKRTQPTGNPQATHNNNENIENEENNRIKSPADAGTPPAVIGPSRGSPEWYALHYDD